MKQLRKMLLALMFISAIAIALPSCMTTKTQVGSFTENSGEEYTYAKGKQVWLFWGVFPLGRTSVKTPQDGNCEIVTKYTFSDILVTTLTGGIFKTYTIKVNAKRPKE